MSDLTKDALTVSLANPGTDYLAPVDEINKASKETMFFYTNTRGAPRTEGKSNCKNGHVLIQFDMFSQEPITLTKTVALPAYLLNLILAQQILSMNLVKEIYNIRLLILMQKLKSRNKK